MSRKEEEVLAIEAQLFSEENVNAFVQDMERAWNSRDVEGYLRHMARDVMVAYKGKSLYGIGYVRTHFLRSEEFKLATIKYEVLRRHVGETRTRRDFENVLKIALMWTLEYDKSTSNDVTIPRMAGETVSGFTELVCQRKKTTNTLEITFFASI